MANFLVTWRIDIEADTAEEAALAAVAIQRKPDSTAVVFEVRDKGSATVTTVDLERDEDCRSCDCRGWDIINADPSTGFLGEIQRCDHCKVFRDDPAACQAARAAGFDLDDGYQILGYPPGFSLTAWHCGRSSP